MNKVNICGVLIDPVTMDEAVASIEHAIAKSACWFVVTPNVDVIVKFQTNPEFRDIYHKAHLVLPDGVPLLWAGAFLGTPFKEKVSGSDLFIKLCAVSAAKGYKVFFLGAGPGVAQKAADKLKKQMPLLEVCGTHSPSFVFDKDEAESGKIIKMLRAAKPDILFVGIGSPRQEEWIYKHKELYDIPVSITVGISFDYAAGTVKRAPKWMQRSGLEWFWRMLMEPKRLWKRYLIDDMKFFWWVLQQKLSCCNWEENNVLKFIKLWVPVGIWAGFIFYLSSTPGFKLLHNVNNGLAYPKEVSDYEFIYRKMAHVAEYFVLTILLRRAFKGSFNLNDFYLFIYPSVVSFLYAVSDEFHKRFVQGRHGSILNLLIDSIGIFIFYIIIMKHSQRDYLVKRAMDIALSMAGLIVFSPIFIIIIIIIKLESPGPVFYKSQRCGRKGRIFNFYKFRSMVCDADKQKESLHDRSEVKGPVFKIKNDPRITHFGKFIRRYSLDELPQLFNVLRGDMSMVGPRPPIPEEVAKYDQWQMRRLDIRPGMTCLWQVRGRSDLSFYKWVKWDIWYIDHWSIGLDMRILLWTIPAVFKSKGAY